MTTHAAPPPPDTFHRAPEALTPVREAPDEQPEAARWRGPVAIGVVLLALVVGQVVALVAIGAAGGEDAPDTFLAGAFVVADLIVLAIIVAFASRGAERLTAATLGIRRTRFWRSLGWTLAIWGVVMALQGIWVLIVGPFSNVESDPGITDTEMIFLLFAVAVMTPVAEEVAFRGYLFPALTRWRGPWIGALVTAIIFGCAHLASSPIEAVLPLAVFGFGACLLYWFTGSLLPAIGLHAANNALVMSVGGDWTWQVPAALAACTALAILLVLPFARERAPHA